MSGIIKVEPISTSHAHNAIEYTMAKDRADKEKPEILRLNHIDMGDLTFSDPTPKDVWNLMKTHQAKYRFQRSEMFVRVELCPPMEKCRDWNNDQWQEWLDGCLRHLDDKNNYYRKQLIKDKDGKPKLDKDGKKRYRTIGKPFRFQDSQYVACIHRDSGKWHVHLIANRVTMDGECMDMHKCHERAIKASDNYADELGWKHTSEYENQRKARIYKDALNVLKSMDAFNLDEYFKGMRSKGWVVRPNTPDSKGVIHGYSVGEYVREQDNTPLMYRASKLGYGDALTMKNLERTWNKVHGDTHTEVSLQTKPVQEERTAPSKTNATAEPAITYEYEGKTFEIPVIIDSYIRENITLPDISDYEDEEIDGEDYQPEIPTENDIAETAAAIFTGAMKLPLEIVEDLLSAEPSGGGGGGGGSSCDDDDDEWKDKARRAARYASGIHTPKHGSKKIKSARRRR
jgi:hypothetical protein